MEIQQYLSKNEKIIWQGKPKPKFSFTLLELGGHYDAMTGMTSVLGLVLGGMVCGCFVFYNSENWIAFVLTLLIGFATILIPDLLKNKRKKNTAYFVTNKRVYFQLWRWGKISIHSIDFQDIARIVVEEYQDKSGILHFLPKKPFGFSTHDFVSGEKRHYPTFEMVQDVKNLQEQLEELRRRILTNA